MRIMILLCLFLYLTGMPATLAAAPNACLAPRLHVSTESIVSGFLCPGYSLPEASMVKTHEGNNGLASRAASIIAPLAVGWGATDSETFIDHMEDWLASESPDIVEERTRVLKGLTYAALEPADAAMLEDMLNSAGLSDEYKKKMITYLCACGTKYMFRLYALQQNGNTPGQELLAFEKDIPGQPHIFLALQQPGSNMLRVLDVPAGRKLVSQDMGKDEDAFRMRAETELVDSGYRSHQGAEREKYMRGYIYNNIGIVCYLLSSETGDHGWLLRAVKYFRRSISLSPAFMTPRRNLRLLTDADFREKMVSRAATVKQKPIFRETSAVATAI